MNEKTGREDARFAGLYEGVGGPIQDEGRFTGAGRGDTEPLEHGGYLGSKPPAGGNARERRKRKIASLKRPVPRRVRIALEGLVPT